MNPWNRHFSTGSTVKREVFSIPSIIAIVAALLSFVVSAGWALFLAVVAILFGVVGFVVALSPRIRGGVVSMLSMFAGGLGALVAVLRLIF